MNFRIRKAMVSDAPAIYAMAKQELGYDFTQEQVENNVRRLIASAENLLLVVVDPNDSAVGFVHANNHEPVYGPPMKDIMAVAIDPKYRNHHLGTKLIRAVEDWAISTGARGVRVNAGIEQKFATRFYKSMGFQYIKTAYNFRKML